MNTLKWPDGKRCAVMFSFDVDGDTTWENGNRGLPNGDRYLRSLSVGQYGPKRCVDRILDKLDEYGVKATFFVPGLTAERYPELIPSEALGGLYAINILLQDSRESLICRERSGR